MAHLKRFELSGALQGGGVRIGSFSTDSAGLSAGRRPLSPESARVWSANSVVFRRTPIIRTSKLGDSNHALRTRRLRMGCHQFDGAKQAALPSSGERPPDRKSVV